MYYNVVMKVKREYTEATDAILDSIADGVFTVDENWQIDLSIGPPKKSRASRAKKQSAVAARKYFAAVCVRLIVLCSGH